MKIGIVDANEKTRHYLEGQISSYIGFWLKWELEQRGLELSFPREADLVFLIHAGSRRFGLNVRRQMRYLGIEPYTQKRGRVPYVITGGPVDATPFLALEYANALAVGEGYHFVRELLGRIVGHESLDDIRGWIKEYPYAIEGSQVEGIQRDGERPWLLARKIDPIAELDGRIDWHSVPPIMSDDNVVRLIASKGCAGKCLFCATAWRQAYSCHDKPLNLLAIGRRLARSDHRVSLVTNDLIALPWFDSIDFRLDSESLSVKWLLNAQGLKSTLARIKAKTLRLGIEGVSDRLRRTIGKPVCGDDLIELMARLMNEYRQNMQLFYIVGLPFENDTDWQEFRDFYYRLTRRVDAMMCRIKFTAFEVAPPSPLARFAAASGYYERFMDTYDWICRNAANRHFTHIKSYKYKSLAKELAATLGISNGLASDLVARGNFDLAPSIEDAERLSWEIIKWPVSAERRWKMAELYRKRLGVGD